MTDLSEDKDHRLYLLNFLQHIIYSLLPVKEQEAEGEYPHSLWTADYWTIEVAKCLLLGNERYLTDPPPRRLEGNPNFDREGIIHDVEFKRAVREHLLSLKDKVGSLLIGEVGRGLDILVASTVKKWDKVYCWDPNFRYGPLLKRFFGEFGDINFIVSPTHSFDYSILEEEVVMVLNHARIGDKGLERFLNCKNISFLINNGVLIKGVE